ncbi:RsbRD N-terminal domain-containing protein [Desulfospira joergensenii]|uniref:RsbRD N-terminal domain-containing protein n=1 Tax=Desulfospira joergensenii TaxID=53329 RepID=UPI0003B77823|nr:RsbRD N-terminal domain-containing protein [Desulfospira joergensenii]
MDAKQAVKEKKQEFLKQWFKATIETYPQESARILGKDADRFDNPVGAVTRETLEKVLDLLSDQASRETLEKALDPLIRIRAVQAFSAADAVSFIFALKTIGDTLIEPDQLIDFYRMVDDIALAGFNKLLKCKEEIFLLKATESKRRIHRAFERAGLVAELKEEDLLGSYKS